MALVVFDRVQETTATTGTGPITLAGAVAGFQSFAVIGNGNTTYYAIVNGTDWEVGVGTYSTTGPLLARTTVLANSLGTTVAINLAGSSNVFVTYPAGKSVNLDASGNVSPLGTITSGVWNGTTIPVAYGGTGVTSSSGANSVVLRDANQNIAVNRVNQSNTTTTAAGGTTALTAASSYIHTLVGTGSQTYVLPDATTIATGVAFVFNNLATGTLTVQDYAAAAIGTIPPGGAGAVFLTSNATVGGTWDLHAYLPEGVTFGTNAFNLGTAVVSGGTWQGGTIQPAYGGTGLTTFVGANNALYSTGASTLTAGTLPILAGGTGATTAPNARTALGATTVGSAVFTAVDAAAARSAIGAGTSSTTGTVTSVSGTGTASGLSLSGTVTTSGNLTLSGTVNSLAAGTYAISVSGNAASANSLNQYANFPTANGQDFNNVTVGGYYNIIWGNFSGTLNTPPGSNSYGNLEVIVGANFITQVYYSHGANSSPCIRILYNGIWTAWIVTLTSANYTSYAPSLTGGGASGTWGINVTGNAATATTATNQSGGTVNATTGTFTGSVTVSSNNVTGGGIILADDGDIVDLNDGFCAMRFSSGVRIFSGNRTGSAVVTLGSTGVVTASSFSGAGTGLTGTASSLTVGTATNATNATTATTLSNNASITGLNFGGVFAMTGSGASTGNSTGMRLSEAYGALWNGADGATWHHQMINGSYLSGFQASGGNFGNGNYFGTGNVTAYYSDERLKTKIKRIDSALEKVLSLEGFIYVENEIARSVGYTNTKEQVGLSAQKVQNVLPQAVSLAPFDMQGVPETGEIVSKSGENYLTVDYSRLVPLLVEAIKELTIQTKELQSELAILREQK